MADIVHAFVCVFSAARYLNIAPAIMGLYQKVSGTAPLLAASRVDFAFSLFSFFDENTTISRFHFFTISPFHDFGIDENTTISPFHLFTFSRYQSPDTMLSPFISPPMAITSRR